MINFFIKNEYSIPGACFLQKRQFRQWNYLVNKKVSVNIKSMMLKENKTTLTIYWGAAKKIGTARKRNNSF